MANSKEDEVIKTLMNTSALADKTSALVDSVVDGLNEKAKLGAQMLTLADNWKSQVEAVAKKNADDEFKKQEVDGRGFVKPNWENSKGTRRNDLYKKAELKIAEAEGYTVWKVKDNPFTYEGDFKIFMNLITRHSMDKPIPYADFIQQIRNDCAVSLKKVKGMKKFYKTGTFSPMYLDYEAFIIAYAHQIVKKVKKTYSVKDPVTNKFIYPDNPSVENLAFPKPIKPKPEKKPKPYEGIEGFDKSEDQLKLVFDEFLNMKAHEIET